MKASALIVAAAGVLLVGGNARAATVPVSDATAFARALAAARPGDVLQLGPGTFAPLRIAGRQFDASVRVVGTAGTVLTGLTITHSRGISLEDVTITPQSALAGHIEVTASSSIQFVGDHFVGASPETGVELAISKDSSQVLVANSEFTGCQRGLPCLQPGGTDITVSHSSFHDCFDCDMVRGGGSGITIADSTFDRALRQVKGNHNDLIQIMGGGPWTIVRDRFGEMQGGAAQVFASPGVNNRTNPIHDLTVASNIFTGTNLYAVFVAGGAKSSLGTPQRIRIVNNTILSGRESSVRIGEPFANAPPDARPILANNILGNGDGEYCGRVIAVRNLLLAGKPCAGEELGPANLTPTDAPTAASKLVVGMADPEYAPPTDFYGRKRVGLPDIGAVEATFAVPTALQLAVPKALGFRLASVRARGWRLLVSVTLSGTTLQGRLLSKGKTVTTASAPVAGKSRYTLALRIPPAHRQDRQFTLSIRLLNGSRSLTRTATVRIFR